MNEVKNILSFFQVFPKTIDGFFNWGVPVLLTTDHLRTQIKNMCPEALDALGPYLKKLDEYSKQMNPQSEIALYQLSTELPTAIYQMNYEVPNYIQKVMGDLGNSTKLVMKNVYPIINSIQFRPIIGPYALVRIPVSVWNFDDIRTRRRRHFGVDKEEGDAAQRRLKVPHLLVLLQ